MIPLKLTFETCVMIGNLSCFADVSGSNSSGKTTDKIFGNSTLKRMRSSGATGYSTIWSDISYGMKTFHDNRAKKQVSCLLAA